jgi:dTDP-4-dehydrorhamnose reductase
METTISPRDFADRLPLLITGVAGVAGFNAWLHFHHHFPGQVFGIRPQQTWQLSGPGLVALDAEDAGGLRDLFRQHSFRSVLNCTGNCALKSCECDPAMAWQLNVASAGALTALAREYRARLVHLSSDLVFSGKGTGNYLESDEPDPVTIYGKSMVEGECVVLSECPDAAILRISLPMGVSFNGHAGAIDWIGSRFRKHRPATLYFDEVRSCTYSDDLNVVFARLLLGDEHGLFHAGGPRPRSLYQIAQVINRAGGYAPELLKGCPRIDAGPLPPRAGNVSMVSDKLLRALDGESFAPWPFAPDLVPPCPPAYPYPAPRWHFERPVERPGGWQTIVEELYHYPGSTLAEIVQEGLTRRRHGGEAA